MGDYQAYQYTHCGFPKEKQINRRTANEEITVKNFTIYRIRHGNSKITNNLNWKKIQRELQDKL